MRGNLLGLQPRGCSDCEGLATEGEGCRDSLAGSRPAIEVPQLSHRQGHRPVMLWLELPGAGQLAVRARGRICEPCAEIRGLAPASRRIASRCCIHDKPTKKTIGPRTPASLPGKSLPPFPRFPGFPGGCWEGPTSQPRGAGFKRELRTTWKAWKNGAPGHQNRARGAGFKSELRTTWKAWKAWKNGAPGHQKQARGTWFPNRF